MAKAASPSNVSRTVASPNGMFIQFNYDGMYRIVSPSSAAGEWTTFRDIATLTVGDKTYIAGTTYGLLPEAETVYEVSKVPTTLDTSYEHIDNKGRDRSPGREKASAPFTG